MSSEPWHYDPHVAPLPWRHDREMSANTKLSFGFIDFDGFVNPHPPVLRGLEMVAKALRANGHELVPWTPPSHLTALELQVLSLHKYLLLTF